MTLADCTEDRVCWHLHVLQNHGTGRRAVKTKFVLLLAGRYTGPATFDDEGGELLAINFRKDDEEVGKATVGDPHLLAGEHEAAVRLTYCARLGAERVGAGAGFAQAVRADHLAGHKLRQILLFLFFGAEHEDRRDGEIALGAHSGAERRVSRELLGDHDGRDLVEVDSAVRFRNVRSEQPERAALGEQTCD